MAIDSRFSKQQFVLEAERRPGSRELSELLQVEVLGLLHEAILSRTNEIVGELNNVGHRLRPYYDPQPGDIAFRDDEGSDADYHCDLRLGVNVVISVGFCDTTSDLSGLD